MLWNLLLDNTGASMDQLLIFSSNNNSNNNNKIIINKVSTISVVIINLKMQWVKGNIVEAVKVVYHQGEIQIISIRGRTQIVRQVVGEDNHLIII